MQVHRCRFVAWQADTITCMTFNPTCSTLAVGRANSNIYFLLAHQRWLIQSMIAGDGQHVHLRNLSWFFTETENEGYAQPVVEERFFSSGLNGEIVEWDLSSNKKKRTVESYGGAVWCMQPDLRGRLLAVGCEDGSLRLFSLFSNSLSTCEYFRVFPIQPDRVLSLAWHVSGKDLFTGGADGSIRRWKVESGIDVYRITDMSHVQSATDALIMSPPDILSPPTQANEKKKERKSVKKHPTPKTKKSRPLIWSLLVLDDMTIVSGNSLGRVEFWDGMFGTLLASFTNHTADVTCLLRVPSTNLSSSQSAIFSASTDSRLSLYHLMPNNRWIFGNSRTVCNRDIFAMAMLDTNTIVTGGLDTTVSVHIINPKSKSRINSNLSSEPQIRDNKKRKQKSSENKPDVESKSDSQSGETRKTKTEAKGEEFFDLNRFRSTHFQQFPKKPFVSLQSRFLLVHSDDSLQLWVLGKFFPEQKAQQPITLNLQQTHCLLLEMKLQGTNIQCSSLSPDLNYIACSDSYTTKLFHLTYEKNEKIAVTRQKLCPDIGAANQLCFTSDSTRLIIATSSPAAGSLNRFSPSIQLYHLSTKNLLCLFTFCTVMIPGRYPSSDGSRNDLEDTEEIIDDGTGRQVRLNRKKNGGIITTVCVSSDSTWLASADNNNNIFIYNLHSQTFYVQLPVFDQPHTSLAFMNKIHDDEGDPSSGSTLLVIALVSNAFYLYDIENKVIVFNSAGSNNEGLKQLLQQREPIMGISVLKSNSSSLTNQFILFSSSSFLYVGLESMKKDKKQKSRGRTKKEQEKNAGSLEHYSQLIETYKPLLFVDFVTPQPSPQNGSETMMSDNVEIVVVEVPPDAMTKALPEPIYQPRFLT